MFAREVLQALALQHLAYELGGCGERTADSTKQSNEVRENKFSARVGKASRQTRDLAVNSTTILPGGMSKPGTKVTGKAYHELLVLHGLDVRLEHLLGGFDGRARADDSEVDEGQVLKCLAIKATGMSLRQAATKVGTASST